MKKNRRIPTKFAHKHSKELKDEICKTVTKTELDSWFDRIHISIPTDFSVNFVQIDH
jgi:hypothetical protein